MACRSIDFYESAGKKRPAGAVSDGGNSGFQLIYELDLCCPLAAKLCNFFTVVIKERQMRDFDTFALRLFALSPSENLLRIDEKVLNYCKSSTLHCNFIHYFELGAKFVPCDILRQV